MPAQTTAQRQEALRARRLMLGLTEVRGIYANPDDHKAIKEYAANLRKYRERLDNRQPAIDNAAQVQ